jgi:hypothetical protein
LIQSPGCKKNSVVTKADKCPYSSYFDWVQEGKVELHVSRIRDELGLGGRNQSVGEIHSYVYCVRISQKQVGDSIHTDEDDCVEALKVL